MEVQRNYNRNNSNKNSNIYIDNNNKNSKISSNLYKNSQPNSFLSSSNNFNSPSSTNTFKTYKLRCVSFNNNIRNTIYDMNMIDSPGYDSNNPKNWLEDILKYIKNRVKFIINIIL